MAGDDDRERVVAECAADCLGVGFVAEFGCKVAVGAGLPGRDGAGESVNAQRKGFNAGEVAIDECEIVGGAGQKVEYAFDGLWTKSGGDASVARPDRLAMRLAVRSGVDSGKYEAQILPSRHAIAQVPMGVGKRV